MNIGIVLAAFFVTIFLGIPIGVSVGLTSQIPAFRRQRILFSEIW